MSFTGKRVVVSGAASGIGRALAAQIGADRPAALYLLDIDPAGLAEVKTSLAGQTVHCLQADVGRADVMEQIFAEIGEAGPVDYVFNNVGIPAGTPAWPDTELTRIQAIIQTNLLGVIYGTRLALPLMRERGGSILNTASVSGLRPYLSGAIYAASKAGVIMFTQSCKDLASQSNVRVNAICPGIVDTPFLTKTGASGAMAGFVQQLLASGAAIAPEAVAKAAIDLAQDESAAGEYRIIEAQRG